MSILAALASKTANDEQLLGNINDALLQLQLEAAGKAEALGYKAEDLESSRQILSEFLEILLRVIVRAQQGQLAAPDTHEERAAESILLRLDEQGRPREDWVEDIKTAILHLQNAEPITAADWELLEQLVDFLDAELARDLVALSKA
jgi:hypothetical protein